MEKSNFFIRSEKINKRGGVSTPLFLCYNRCSVYTIMDREKLKLMVRNLELLVDSIKAEVYSDVDAYKTSVDTNRLPGMNDYDEVFNDDDGYPD